LATANAICLRFHVVFAERAAFRASLTLAVIQAPSTADTPIRMAAGITLRVRGRQNADIGPFAFIFQIPTGPSPVSSCSTESVTEKRHAA
jgi:hypothetical protein